MHNIVEAEFEITEKLVCRVQLLGVEKLDVLVLLYETKTDFDLFRTGS